MDRRKVLLYQVRHADSELGRLRMILHLYVVCDGYRFGSRPRLSAVASCRYAVALPPRRPESVAPRISLPLAARGAKNIVALLDGILT